MPKFSAYMKGGDGSVGPPGASIINGVLADEGMLPVPNQDKYAFLVGTSNPKHLWVWNEEKEGENKWEDQGLTASEIGEVTANASTVIWNIPASVTTRFTTSNQIDYLDFDFDIPMGRPAGFGNVTATISSTNWDAQPSISTSTNGEDWAKNFKFDFNIPVGRPAGFGNINVTTESLSSNVGAIVSVTTVNSSPDYAKDFNFYFGIPEGVAAGFSTEQHVSVSTLDTGENATVEITTVTSSPEYAKEFNFHFGIPKGDALAIYEGIPFTTENGEYYHWDTSNNTTTLVFSRGSVEKLPIYIYNNNNQSIAATFKLSSSTIEYEADEKFNGTMYLMMPTTLQNVEIGTVSTTTFDHQAVVSKSTGSTTTNLILDFVIPKGEPATNGTYYVVGTQTQTTGSWTGNLPEIEALYNGLTIDYWLPYAGSGDATLNLTLKNGVQTGPINCYYSGTSRLTTNIPANNVCRLTYQTVNINETNYTGWWLSKTQDYNDSAWKLYRGAGNLIADSVIYRYQLLFSIDETKVTPLNNVSNNTGTTKTMLTNVAFDPFGEIFYWDSSSTINANGSLSSTARWTSNFDLRYTFNCGSTLTAHKPVYLKVLLQSDGKVKIANSMPITQDLPTTNDGILYIFLGRTYSTYQLYLYPTHPIYYHDGNGIKEYIRPHGNTYGYCTTAAGTVAKTVSIPNFKLETGVTIFVKFQNSNSASNPTLNVNSTGAKQIYRYGTTAASTTSGTNGWQAGAVLALTYDGTGWIEHYWYNNTYTLANNCLGSGHYTANSAIYRYQLLVHTDREHLSPFNNDNNITTTTKTILTNIEFDPFEQIYCYDSTTNVSADSLISGGSLYYTKENMDLRIVFNIDDDTSPLTLHKDVYMKVTPLSNGKVKLASAMPLVQQLPSTNDGYWYIFLGRATTRAYGLTLYPDKPVFYHDGTRIRQKFNPYLEKEYRCYHVTATIPQGTTKSFTVTGCTPTMRVINCVFGTPSNVTSSVQWTTTTDLVKFDGTFTGNTDVDFDLIESETLTAIGI